MRAGLRELLVTTAIAVCLAGPVAGTVLPLLPAAWRTPLVPWGILLTGGALVALVRRRRSRRP